MNRKELFKQLCLDAKWFRDHTIIEEDCYICGKPLTPNDFEIKSSYWKSYWVGTHKDCTMVKDIIECQTIDSDCNDCKHFKRGKMEDKGIFNGECLKYNKQVKAYPNFCSNHSCFEHRKK